MKESIDAKAARILELGSGNDLDGSDYTKAALRAEQGRTGMHQLASAFEVDFVEVDYAHAAIDPDGSQSVLASGEQHVSTSNGSRASIDSSRHRSP